MAVGLLVQPLPAHRPGAPKGTVCQVDEVPFAEPAAAAAATAKASAHAYLMPPTLAQAQQR